MAYLLNIGLDNMPPEAGGAIGRKALYASRALRKSGFTITGAFVRNSDTEPTLVALANFESVNGAFGGAYKLAEALGQDCIAIRNETTGVGQLMGPRSDNWGAFDPKQFLLLDGTRLAK
jgi:hypothetical protein